MSLNPVLIAWSDPEPNNYDRLPQLCYAYTNTKGGSYMQTAVKTKKVGDMTTIELKNLIKDTLFEVIDPDYGLELRAEVEKELIKSRKQKTQDKDFH